MACMMVDKDTIDRIVTHFHVCPDDFTTYFPGFMCRENALGSALWNMNLSAYNTRYPYAQISMAPTYEFTPRIVSPLQLAHTLEFFLYQCNEGRNNALYTYESLRRFRELLCCQIVSGLPEYQACEWS